MTGSWSAAWARAFTGTERIPRALFAVALLARLAAWPFSDVVDADAVTRAIIGESYMHYPGWYGDGVWPPLHFYLNGVATVLFGGRVPGTVLVNILLGSALAFPVFAFARRWAGDGPATAVTIMAVFNPLVFRNSLQGLSEVPFLFFSACAFNAVAAVQEGTTPGGTRRAALGGLFLSIACGMRYEAWLFIVPLALPLLLARRWRGALAFAAFALLFPALWMLSDLRAHGNPFHGIEHLVHWRGAGPEQPVPDHELRLRTVFFPLSWLLACSPLALPVVLAGGMKALGRARRHLPWLLLWPLFFALVITKARAGELLLQHRFTMTLVLLALPWLTLGFSRSRSGRWTVAIATVCAVWGLGASMRAEGPAWLGALTKLPRAGNEVVWIRGHMLRDQRCVPQLVDRLPDALVPAIDQVRMERKLLVLDHFGWEETYNTAFRADILATSIVLLPPAGEEGRDEGMHKLQNYLEHLRDPQGVLAMDTAGAFYAGLRTGPGGKPVLDLPHGRLPLAATGRVRHIALFRFTTEWEGQ